MEGRVRPLVAPGRLRGMTKDPWLEKLFRFAHALESEAGEPLSAELGEMDRALLRLGELDDVEVPVVQWMDGLEENLKHTTAALGNLGEDLGNHGQRTRALLAEEGE